MEWQSYQQKHLKFKILEPKTLEPYPFLLYLHGSGSRGEDNEQQLRHLMTLVHTLDTPCFIFAPQCPKDVRWTNADWKILDNQPLGQPTPLMLHVMSTMAELIDKYNIDSERIYVAGASMGGFGVCDILMRLPNVFAAALVVCGGGDITQVNCIAHIPIWFFHNIGDSSVSVNQSRVMVKALKAAHGLVNYTEEKRNTHNAWTNAYTSKPVIRWLFRQRNVQ